MSPSNILSAVKISSTFANFITVKLLVKNNYSNLYKNWSKQEYSN